MNLYLSVLRTVVPLFVGWLLTVTGALGIDVDSEAAAGGVTVVVAAVYHALFRVLEDAAVRLKWEPLRLVAGALLGWARPPEYPAKPDASLAALARRTGR
ncbi:hypothetical protein [Streptomyces synnematoformans]|uniref:Holin n=1 Tax=Streptomyces synnematoformans TaxID=415721 RepID=A0ABP5J1T0_9ACTN